MEKQDMQRIIEMLVKMDADRKAWREEMAAERRAIQARTEDTQAEMEEMACREMTEAHPEEKNPTSVDMKPELTQNEKVPVEVATVMPVVETEESSNTREEMMSCQEMEARQDEQKPTSADRKPEAAKEEVPKEDAIVKPVNERNRRHRGKKKAAE
jgi:hypothetical protein